MKVIQKTDRLMVLKDMDIGSIIIGVLVAAFGILGIVTPSISTPPIPIYLAIILLVIGVYLILSAKTRTFTLDKNANKLLIDTQSIIAKSKIDCLLDQVRGLQLKQETHHYTSSSRSGSHTGHTRTTVVSKTYIILKNGSELFLDKGVLMGKEISDFLKVPFQGYGGSPVIPETSVPLVPQTGMENAPLEKVEKPTAPESR
jgi:hypothetical protein